MIIQCLTLTIFAVVLVGLFRYSICQSGSPTAYWATADKVSSRTITNMFAKQYHCEKESDKEMKDCLMALSSKTLTNGKYTVRLRQYFLL